MFTRCLIIFALVIGVAAVFSFAATDDGTGGIEGTITDDQTGEPIANVSILVVGTKYGATSTDAGYFSIPHLSPGSYELRLTHIDYEPVTISNIRAVAGQITSITPMMKPIEGEQTAAAADKEESDCAIVIDIEGHDYMPREQKIGVLSSPAISAEKRSSRYCGVPKPNVADATGYFPPAHGGNAIVNGEAFDAMFFKNYGVNPFVDTEDDHFSTFAVDVDDASFVMTRSYLERGSLPPDEAVRAEEFINHFDYGYTRPDGRAFSIHLDGAPSKFGTTNVRLLRIGIQGAEIRPENRKPANLVFVVDVSGSMGREDRLGLVRKALRLLVDQLTVQDRVGIVVYGSQGRVLLEPTSIANRDRIISVIEQLVPEGATNAEEGIRLGYTMAKTMFDKAKINRIILCSDGVANVGVTGPDGILKQIKAYADMGITLSSIGFGMGNYNDILLEKLGNKGNGFYAYVDDLAEARRVFVDNLTGTLQVIARDVKIQVDFDSTVVRSYRLIGYENRDVADEKFRDDTEDGGEIGSGHSVTALYEVKLHKHVASEQDLGKVYIRFKDPDNGEVIEVNRTIGGKTFAAEFDRAPSGLRLAAAAAEFAEILRKSYWAKSSSLAEVQAVAEAVYRESNDQDVLELVSLISKAAQFEDQLATK